MPTTQIIKVKAGAVLGWSSLVGSSVASALSDNDTSTYIEADATNTANQSLSFDWDLSSYPNADFSSGSRLWHLTAAKPSGLAPSDPEIKVDGANVDLGTAGTGFITVDVPVTGNPTPGGSSGTITIDVSRFPIGGLLRLAEFDLRLTFNSLPNAPTSLTPASAATVTTLTPTFAGTRSDPDNDAMTAYQIEVRRNSDSALMWLSGEQTSGITGANFSRVYGGTALVNGETYKWRAQTKEAAGFGAWSSYRTFTVSINTAPTAVLVSPVAGAQVGDTTPDLTLNFSDPDSGTNGQFASYQIQVRRVSDQASMWNMDPPVLTDAGQQSARQAVVTYAGTALVSGTAYEWRARVTDGAGAISAYTGWEQFTPVTAPNPPTLTSPSGLTNTLTPTVQGVYNQGTGGAESAFQYEVRQNGVTIYQSGDVATAIATGQAYGTNNPSDTPATPPALAWGTSYEIRARSKDAAAAYSSWTSWLAFHTNAAPTTPTNLSPNGGITGDTTPTLGWTHNDPDGDAQTAADIELRKVSDNSLVTGYGPKTLTQATMTHDVTETLTASPATDYKFRVWTKGLAGPGYGPASDWVTFTVASAPTLVVTEPDPDEVFTGPSFTVTWNAITGGSGVQQDYRVRVYQSDQVTVLYDSTVLAGTNTSHLIPATSGIRTGQTYYVRVTVRDTLNQSADSGFIRVTATFTPPAQVTGHTVTFIGDQTP